MKNYISYFCFQTKVYKKIFVKVKICYNQDVQVKINRPLPKLTVLTDLTEV